MPYDSTTQDRLEERSATYAEVALWVKATNRSTGADEAMGFWTGQDHIDLTIGGETRTYYGAGGLIEVGEIRSGLREQVVYHQVVMPALLDEVRQALRVYDARLADVEIHSIPRDPDTYALGDPVRMVKGILNEYAEEIGGTMGGEVEAVTRLEASSAARFGTFSLPIVRSDTQMRRRNPNDDFRQYVGTAGVWPVPWGTKGE